VVTVDVLRDTSMSNYRPLSARELDVTGSPAICRSNSVFERAASKGQRNTWRVSIDLLN
jgi:hypothetical protein